MGNKMLEKYVDKIALRVASQVNLDKVIIAQSLLHVRANKELKRIKNLSEVEFRGFSQWGEDGILNWLVGKIPNISPSFIEFGVENYRESNTRLLLWLRNWRGVVIDGSENNIQDIRKQDVSWRFDLQSICAFIDRDNINSLITSTGLHGEIGILSVDIDGNDYWVWDAINTVSPAIVVCEYNAVFGDLNALTIPYDPAFYVTQAHYTNLYFGASIQAVIELGKRKGYQLVGTNSNGCNAFFVRDDYAGVVLEAIDNVKIYSSCFRSARDQDGNLTLVSGSMRAESIGHLPVFNIERKETMALANCGELYSPEWRGRI
ncbi:hypothetical protein [Gallionella capsiferriformans]|uniref:Uncharacterized protein n=1 Tax=Gallionella capsiferriformans (strain ES-2) TaxID=395494 RepID=D9SFK7_GALCS|nr:hypothetical protein [Gallionella capsiferriformans]ADL55304.1 hypothetical protein Galf_1277 [Gallionella capsiferriformans ES-2]